MTMTKPVENNLDESIDRLTKLGPTRLHNIGLERVVMHYAAAPSAFYRGAECEKGGAQVIDLRNIGSRRAAPLGKLVHVRTVSCLVSTVVSLVVSHRFSYINSQ